MANTKVKEKTEAAEEPKRTLAPPEGMTLAPSRAVKPAVIESMTRIVYDQASVRVWRNEDKVSGSYDCKDLLEAADEVWVSSIAASGRRRQAAEMQIRQGVPIFDDAGYARLRKALAEKLIAMDRVATVEVLDDTGCGLILYREWP